MLSELKEYATAGLIPPSDKEHVLATEQYLRALNDIFERTLLGDKTRIFQTGGSGIQRLEKGFSFFADWAQEIYKNGGFKSGIDNKNFISWQVYDYILCTRNNA